MHLKGEDAEQAAVVDWVYWQYPVIENLVYHCRNQGIQGSRGQRMAYGEKYRRLGVRQGIPDLIVDVPTRRFHGLRLEMKTRSGSTNAGQREIHRQMMMQGYLVVTCRGAEVAICVLKHYLSEVCWTCGVWHPGRECDDGAETHEPGPPGPGSPAAQ